jgi:hypothetical protein
MVKIFMNLVVVDCFDEPVFLAVHAGAVGRSRMRGYQLRERLTVPNARSYFAR